MTITALLYEMEVEFALCIPNDKLFLCPGYAHTPLASPAL